MKRIKSEIKNLIDEWRWHCSAEAKYRCEAYGELLEFINSLQEEPVSEDLEEAANDYAHDLVHDDVFETFIAGAQWKKGNLWKNAQGNNLPEIDREVIALLNNGEVVFAHRPPEYWMGKNIGTGEITRYEPKRYDNGCWNQPNVVWWLDLDLPIEGE